MGQLRHIVAPKPWNPDHGRQFVAQGDWRLGGGHAPARPHHLIQQIGAGATVHGRRPAAATPPPSKPDATAPLHGAPGPIYARQTVYSAMSGTGDTFSAFRADRNSFPLLVVLRLLPVDDVSLFPLSLANG